METVQLTDQEKTATLGAIIQAYHTYFVERGAITPRFLEKDPKSSDMIREGIELAAEQTPSLKERLLPVYEQLLQ